jgi:hypothetical protein
MSTKYDEYNLRYSEGESPSIEDIETIVDRYERFEVIRLAYNFGLQVDYERHEVSYMRPRDHFMVLMYAYRQKQLDPHFASHRLAYFTSHEGSMLLIAAYEAGMVPDYMAHGIGSFEPTCRGRVLVAAYEAGLPPDRTIHQWSSLYGSSSCYKVVIAAYKAGLKPVLALDLEILAGSWTQDLVKSKFVITLYECGLKPTAAHLTDLCDDYVIALVTSYLYSRGYIAERHHIRSGKILTNAEVKRYGRLQSKLVQARICRTILAHKATGCSDVANLITSMVEDGHRHLE